MRVTSVVALLAAIALLSIVTFLPSPWEGSRPGDLAYLALLLLLVASSAVVAASSPAPAQHSSPAQIARRFGARLALATALNLLYWVVVIEPHVYPDEHLPFPLIRAAALVDLPVASLGLLSRLLRDQAVDVHMQSFPYGSTRFCFGVPPGHLWSHLAIAIPTWLVLLYIPGVARHLAKRV